MKTPLQLASQALLEKDLTSFSAILKRAPYLLDQSKESWFLFAGRKGYIEGLDYLLKLGCDPNTFDSTGTALCKAAAYGHMDAVKWLLEHGATLELDANDIVKDPLFAAIQSGELAIAKFLIERGINTTITYPCGRDALAFAKQKGQKEIVKILGGDPDEPREPCVKTAIPDFTGQRFPDELIEGVEQELGIKFPLFYRNFLKNEFPDKLFHSEAKDNDDWKWLGPDYLMFHTARSFIAYNSEDPRETKKRLEIP